MQYWFFEVRYQCIMGSLNRLGLQASPFEAPIIHRYPFLKKPTPNTKCTNRTWRKFTRGVGGWSSSCNGACAKYLLFSSRLWKKWRRGLRGIGSEVVSSKLQDSHNVMHIVIVLQIYLRIFYFAHIMYIEYGMLCEALGFKCELLISIKCNNLTTCSSCYNESCTWSL